MVNNNLVIGTLEFGIKRPNKFYIIVVVDFFICFIATLIPFLYILISGDNTYPEGTIIGLGGFSILFFIYLVIVLICWLRQVIYFNRKARLYLDDYNSVKILVRPFETSCLDIGIYKRIMIAVKLSYNDKELVLYSKKHDKQFRKYVDKEIPILYSPKYKQVVFINEAEQNQKI